MSLRSRCNILMKSFFMLILRIGNKREKIWDSCWITTCTWCNRALHFSFLPRFFFLWFWFTLNSVAPVWCHGITQTSCNLYNSLCNSGIAFWLNCFRDMSFCEMSFKHMLFLSFVWLHADEREEHYIEKCWKTPFFQLSLEKLFVIISFFEDLHFLQSLENHLVRFSSVNIWV